MDKNNLVEHRIVNDPEGEIYIIPVAKIPKWDNLLYALSKAEELDDWDKFNDLCSEFDDEFRQYTYEGKLSDVVIYKKL